VLHVVLAGILKKSIPQPPLTSRLRAFGDAPLTLPLNAAATLKLRNGLICLRNSAQARENLPIGRCFGL